MTEYYQDTNDIDVLRARVEELSRIRQDFTTHLGSSLYEVTKDNDSLRWGRESLYMGIADCDEERTMILKKITDIESRVSEPEFNIDPSLDETLVTMPLAAEPEGTIEEKSLDSLPESEAESQFGPIVESEQPIEDTTELEPEVTPEPEVVSEVAPEPEAEPEIFLQPEPPAPVNLCPVCGYPHDEGAGFCMNCGASLAAPEPEPEPEPEVGSVCPKCGAHVNEGDRFCMECGNSLMVAKPEPAPAPNPSVCPFCGNPVDPSFKFCMNCGHKLV